VTGRKILWSFANSSCYADAFQPWPASNRIIAPYLTVSVLLSQNIVRDGFHDAFPFGTVLPRPRERPIGGYHPACHRNRHEDHGPDRTHSPPCSVRPLSRRGLYSPKRFRATILSDFLIAQRPGEVSRGTWASASSIPRGSSPPTREIRVTDPHPDWLRRRVVWKHEG
jgi:hypothetical protein